MSLNLDLHYNFINGHFWDESNDNFVVYQFRQKDNVICMQI